MLESVNPKGDESSEKTRRAPGEHTESDLIDYEAEIARSIQDVVDLFEQHRPGHDSDSIVKAANLAVEVHAGQTRLTGEPYVLHPLAVAKRLADYGLDLDTVVAAILHDTVEDTDIALDDIEAQFGGQAAALIDGVTKLMRIDYDTKEEQQAATIRKMTVAMAKDVRVLLIKLADRLHNLQTIGPLPQWKQERTAQETLDIYAPLAHRLGVQEIKHELEDRCFAILHPSRNAEITDLLTKRAPARQAVIEQAVAITGELMNGAGIKADISGRPKHNYSIYRKMVNSGQPFEQIHDLIGIRILTDDVKDCYAALGVIHSRWAPVHGRFKDYIATPKFNLYQSLHTTVLGPNGKPLEVQIRTHEMHHRAEYGIASHWRYKEGAPEDLEWMSDIRFLQDTYENPADFLAGLKLDLYRDEVFAVTPKGRVITLPKGATTVDFAYAIHSEVGNRTNGARVNGRLVPLSTELKSGDIVEITTSNAADAAPSRDWLQFTVTNRAISKIRQHFNRERRDEAQSNGKESVMKAIAKLGLGLTSAARDKALAAVAEDLSYADIDMLFVAVGEGNVAASTVANRLWRQVEPTEDDDGGGNLLDPIRPARPQPGPSIIVEGATDVMVRITKCCAPVPGDEIEGFVTVGRGVSVHRSDCTNLSSLNERSDRMIDVSWAADRIGGFAVWIQVEALDRPWLLRDVTEVLSQLDANIYASSSGTNAERVAVLRYEVQFSDPGQLERALKALRGVDGVFEAYRLRT